MTGTEASGRFRRSEVHDVPCIGGRLPARPPSIPLLRRRVTRLATEHGAGEALAARIGLAVTEAATNVVRHAYEREHGGSIHYAADVDDGDLQVLVSDDGAGVRAGGGSDGLGLGLGLSIIAEVTSDFSIVHRHPRGVDVWMRFVF